MNKEFQDKINMLRGDAKPRLSEEQRKKLAAAYIELFIGLSGANWARDADKKLGAAWYDTLGQIKSMLGARDKNNPATEYLMQFHATHNIQMSRQMMTDPNKDAALGLADAGLDEWRKNANKRVGDAMKSINEMTEQFKTRQQPQAQAQAAASNAPQKFDAARQKLLQQQQMLMAILAKQKQNGNAA